MKKLRYLKLGITLFLFTSNVYANKYKYEFSAGTYIQQYNGNLGNSFFRFNATCFAGTSLAINRYLNKSLDASLGIGAGHFGYCQTESDKLRIVSINQRCPGCLELKGMGELRSLMLSGNVALKYKFDNGYLLSENSKISPSIFIGLGINYLSDIMKRNCVNEGLHYTINAGAGLKYNITNRFSVGYTMTVGCFMKDKVYLTNESIGNVELEPADEDEIAIERRKDLYLQNALNVSIKF